MRIGLGIGIGSTEGKFGQVINARALVLRWNAMSNAPVVDPTSVAQWNTLFDLPANGTAFSSVTAQGNHVYLYGGGGITLKNSLFYNNANIISIIDNSNVIELSDDKSLSICNILETVYFPVIESASVSSFALNQIIVEYNFPSLTDAGTSCFEGCPLLATINIPLLFSAGVSCFASCPNVSTFNFPLLVSIGSSAFDSCTGMTSCYIPSCTTMGGAVTDDTVFANISGQTITLTVPAALMTCNAGGIHASIAALQLSNTVTVIQV